MHVCGEENLHEYPIIDSSYSCQLVALVEFMHGVIYNGTLAYKYQRPQYHIGTKLPQILCFLIFSSSAYLALYSKACFIHPQQWFQAQQALRQRPPLPLSRCWSCLPRGIRGRSPYAATVDRCAMPTALPWLPKSAGMSAASSSLATNANPRSTSPAARTSAAVAMAQVAIPAALTAVWAPTARPAAVTTATPALKIVARPPAATDTACFAHGGFKNSACPLASATATITA
jgi:hypothetical protein